MCKYISIIMVDLSTPEFFSIYLGNRTYACQLWQGWPSPEIIACNDSEVSGRSCKLTNRGVGQLLLIDLF